MIKILILLITLQVYSAQANEAENCLQCHIQETLQWQTSQHAHAMQPATTDTVLGDFNQTRFVSEALEADFQLKNGQYRINLTEAGQRQQWTVRYTLGVYPLQQYLIDIGDGKLQALNIAWDSRNPEQGGQHWFRLDDKEHQRPGDPFHWRGVYQNWNSMCADCHTSGLQKGYTPDQDDYTTLFDQVNVSCSACHADASKHEYAAREGRIIPAGSDLQAKGAWHIGTTQKKPQHTGPLSSTQQVETCGRCHALRTRLNQAPNGRIHDQYSLNRLQSPLYFTDGRVREEVFVLGSFLQSKMHQAGVVCSNCHNSHTAKPVAQGNALCSQCHSSDSFDTPEHHKHPPESSGAQCVSCHMPERTYMQIDSRREHNFTTPNPVTSKQAASPDPCLICHDNKTRDWSIQQLANLWPGYRERSQWFDIQQDDLPAIAGFIADQSRAALYRASLLENQAPALAQSTPKLILEQLLSPEPLLRESGWKAAASLHASTVQPQANTGLNDQYLSVRLAAFETLMLLNALPATHEKTRIEYEAYLDQLADRPSGRTLKAQYMLTKGLPEIAEQNLNIALKMDNAYLPAYMLLTNLLRTQQRFRETIKLLTQGLEQLQENASLLHLRGLTRLQLNDYENAEIDLQHAATVDPENWLFSYRYALLLFYLGKIDRAIETTQRLEKMVPGNAQVEGLILQLRKTKKTTQ